MDRAAVSEAANEGSTPSGCILTAIIFCPLLSRGGCFDMTDVFEFSSFDLLVAIGLNILMVAWVSWLIFHDPKKKKRR